MFRGFLRIHDTFGGQCVIVIDIKHLGIIARCFSVLRKLDDAFQFRGMYPHTGHQLYHGLVKIHTMETGIEQGSSPLPSQHSTTTPQKLAPWQASTSTTLTNTQSHSLPQVNKQTALGTNDVYQYTILDLPDNCSVCVKGEGVLPPISLLLPITQHELSCIIPETEENIKA